MARCLRQCEKGAQMDLGQLERRKFLSSEKEKASLTFIVNFKVVVGDIIHSFHNLQDDFK